MGPCLGRKAHRAIRAGKKLGIPGDLGFEQKDTVEICHSEPKTSWQRPEAMMDIPLGYPVTLVGEVAALEGLIQNPSLVPFNFHLHPRRKWVFQELAVSR